MTSTRTRLLDATAQLLAHSPDGDVSTREVADVADVGVPTLYRHFGDKHGLVQAAVDHAYRAYLDSKRAVEPSDDPVADLRAGWDNHLAFAVDNPHVYRLLFGAAGSEHSDGIAESYALLVETLDRIAAAGRLRTSTEHAADVVMAASVGAAMSLLGRPARYTDRSSTTALREAVIADLVDERDHITAATDTAAAAAQLRAHLRDTTDTTLTANEAALLGEWLDRLADPPTGTSGRPG